MGHACFTKVFHPASLTNVSLSFKPPSIPFTFTRATFSGLWSCCPEYHVPCGLKSSIWWRGLDEVFWKASSIGGIQKLKFSMELLSVLFPPVNDICYVVNRCTTAYYDSTTLRLRLHLYLAFIQYYILYLQLNLSSLAIVKHCYSSVSGVV